MLVTATVSLWAGACYAQSSVTQNTVRFDSATYRGLTVGGMYGFSNEAGQFSNDRVYSLGAKYESGPVTLAAAFEQVNRSANPNDVNASDAIRSG